MSLCSLCGAEFQCGMVDANSHETCWCTALPSMPRNGLLRDTTGTVKTCMCPTCLAALRAGRLGEQADPSLH